MKNLKTFSLALAMLISFLTFGQEKTITGVVSDSSGPLPGASVFVKSTNKGVQTDVDGKYSIKAKTGDILIYSFIGYDSKNITVGTANVINVKLSENSKNLEEVLITSAMGIKRKKDEVFTSASEISSSGAKNVLPQNYLQNKISGVQVITNAKGIKINGKKTENHDNESYDNFIENPFESPKTAPLSTFSIDVDNASYTNVRRFINNGQVVPKDAVRVEEMVNFFKYNYPQPLRENPFSINTEYSDCPWNSNNKLVRIGLQGKIIETDNLPVSNMVFLIDVSGSMSDINKLPLLKESLKILVKQLRNEDKISMVVYAGAAGLVLPPTSGKDKKTNIDALDKLESGGSTAGGAGIELAYKVAQENFIKGGNNRVILATDGDFNVGSSSNTDMQTLIEEKRKSGVFLTCLGYGMGNYKDSKMEILADKGNGNYAYIDNIQEANRFLGKEFKGSMFAIAKDVKIQIEFNPKHVQAYRLIGYENRKLRDEDFTNDAIDAGELGSGHTVTALYEIIPRGVKSDLYNEPTDLKYSVMAEPSSKNYSEELATINFRYKKPDGDKSIEMSSIIANKASDLQSTSEDFKFCASVAWFGLKLRDSKLVVNKSNDAILELANQGLTNDFEGYRAEFIRLIENVRL
jgi:Ca-activated chloride channel family protein